MGELVNFCVVIQCQRNFHIRPPPSPKGKSVGMRAGSLSPVLFHSLKHETDVVSQLKQNHGNDTPDNCSGSCDVPTSSAPARSTSSTPWISQKKINLKSYYHNWDNRLMSSFVTEKDGRFAETLFHSPSTACCGNNLNSEVQMVKSPDSPLRHGNRFLAWIHRHLDVDVSQLLRAKSIDRCSFGNTLPLNHFYQPKTVGFMVTNPRGDRSQAPEASCTHRRPSPSRQVHTSPRSDATKEVPNCSLRDSQSGTFDLTVKTYFPSPSQPGGTLSHILDCLPLSSEVEIRGPTGDVTYHGKGHFSV
ncbi:hypothetical protein GE21DRAFT_1346991 [Neurospora crassa]|nr:hypothetical protein GE21DRAFT_1346991 [Neurospora crassa]